MIINGLSSSLSTIHMNSSLRFKSPDQVEYASINQRLASSDSYQPDLSIFDSMEEGDVGSLTSWTESQTFEFHQQDTDDIINNIDFTNTTQDELFATISVLGQRGVINSDAGALLSFTVGLDQNLNNGESFNALDYFEKSLKGLENASRGLNNSNIVQDFKTGSNMIKALQSMKESGQLVMSADEYV